MRRAVSNYVNRDLISLFGVERVRPWFRFTVETFRLEHSGP
jgi:hypothetical protein